MQPLGRKFPAVERIVPLRERPPMRGREDGRGSRGGRGQAVKARGGKKISTEQLPRGSPPNAVEPLLDPAVYSQHDMAAYAKPIVVPQRYGTLLRLITCFIEVVYR